MANLRTTFVKSTFIYINVKDNSDSSRNSDGKDDSDGDSDIKVMKKEAQVKTNRSMEVWFD